MQVQPLGWEDPLKECMATHSNILAWSITMDRGAWWAAVHGDIKSRTQLKQHSTHTHTGERCAFWQGCIQISALASPCCSLYNVLISSSASLLDTCNVLCLTFFQVQVKWVSQTWETLWLHGRASDHIHFFLPNSLLLVPRLFFFQSFF